MLEIVIKISDFQFCSLRYPEYDNLSIRPDGSVIWTRSSGDLTGQLKWEDGQYWVKFEDLMDAGSKGAPTKIFYDIKAMEAEVVRLNNLEVKECFRALEIQTHLDAAILAEHYVARRHGLKSFFMLQHEATLQTIADQGKSDAS